MAVHGCVCAGRGDTCAPQLVVGWCMGGAWQRASGRWARIQRRALSWCMEGWHAAHGSLSVHAVRLRGGSSDLGMQDGARACMQDDGCVADNEGVLSMARWACMGGCMRVLREALSQHGTGPRARWPGVACGKAGQACRMGHGHACRMRVRGGNERRRPRHGRCMLRAWGGCMAVQRLRTKAHLSMARAWHVFGRAGSTCAPLTYVWRRRGVGFGAA
jgi:hypothetical protein